MRRRPKIQPFEEFYANWEPEGPGHWENFVYLGDMHLYDTAPRDERDRMKEEG